jgi:hypothetical protein
MVYEHRHRQGKREDNQQGEACVSEDQSRRRQAAAMLASSPDLAPGYVAEDDRHDRGGKEAIPQHSAAMASRLVR